VEFSVVIPTHNRAVVLHRCLSALAAQTNAGDYEVLVVDDGSTDETHRVVTSLRKAYPVRLHYFYQPNRKQGAARNLGVRQAKGDWVLFLGDDIVPVSTLLAEHRNHHAKWCDDAFRSKTVVIGYTTWPEDIPTTRFLAYIGEQGWQFGFSLIEDPDRVPFNYFYTSNLSLSRRFFLEAGGFDEDFREYGWEDIELSLRLEKRGMRLVYAPEAKGFHHHPIDIASFVGRQIRVGSSAWNFYRKHPEMESFLSIDRIPEYRPLDRARMRLLTWLCRITETWRRPDLSRYYPDLMSYYYLQGLIAGRETEAGEGLGGPGGEGAAPTAHRPRSADRERKVEA
jgi:GT2 family glycosyltransferase